MVCHYYYNEIQTIKICKGIIMTLSDRTIKTYNEGIKRIKKMGLDVDTLNENELIECMKKNNLPLSSQGICISSMIWYNKEKRNDMILEEKLQKMNEEIMIQKSANYDKNQLSEAEKKTYVPWPIIIKIYDDLKEKALKYNTERLNDDCMILSFYVHHPPRRLDYYNMYISDDQIFDNKMVIKTNNGYSCEWNTLTKAEKEEIKKKQIKTDKNYYSNGYFIFDDYKTYNKYGRQIIEVKSELDQMIKERIKRLNLKTGDRLINLNHNNFRKRIMSIFEDYVGKKSSVDILRHSFISDLIEKNKTMEERKIISLMMGHSIITQGIYNKIETYEDIEINYSARDGREKVYTKFANDRERKEKLKEDKRRWYAENKQTLKKKQKVKEMEEIEKYENKIYEEKKQQ